MKKHWDNRMLFFNDGCPFCKTNYFLEGPHGGLSINFKCRECGAIFNDMGPFGIDLISMGKMVTSGDHEQRRF
ncbi:hypothetical protein ES702_06537 [subsurface metagenome]